MRRFKLSEKLRKKAQAPLPTEIERPTGEKEPKFRKWLIRIISISIVLAIAYILFQNIFISKVDGLIEPEEITVESPADGTILSFFDEGDFVPAGKTIAKVFNPEVEKSIKDLNFTIRELIKWKKELEKENQRRKEEVKANKELSQFSLLISTPSKEEIVKEIRILKSKEARLLEEKTLIESEISRLRRLVQLGAATSSELEAKLRKLSTVESALADVRATMVKLKTKLKLLKEKPTLAQVDINPLLPQIQSLDYQIISLENTVRKLSAKLSTFYISFDYPVKISEILPSGSAVSKGTVILKAIRPDKLVVTAFVEPKKANRLRIGDRARIVLPNGVKLEGEIVRFGSSLILKPAVLVGPLEKRTLVLPVKIEILEPKEVRKIAYANMPVTVIFNKF